LFFWQDFFESRTPLFYFFAFRKYEYDYTGKEQESKYYFWCKMTRKRKKVCEKIVILNKKISFRGCAYAVRVL